MAFFPGLAIFKSGKRVIISSQETLMTLKQAIITSLLFYKIAIFGGFSAETLVKVPSGYIAIKALKIGDRVICQGPGDEYR
jgi:hypothetical protein